MEISGKVIQVLEEQSGQSSKGTWRKQQYVIETQEQYPKKICFMVWGDKIDEFGIREGQDMEVSIDIESREFNGRWYTDVKAWKVSLKGSNNQSNEPSNDTPFPDEEPLGAVEGDEEGDLPF